MMKRARRQQDDTATESTSRAYAEMRDTKDPLAAFRSRFHVPKKATVVEAMQNSSHGDMGESSAAHGPLKAAGGAGDDEDCVYLCGNSLGLQPRSLQAEVQRELDVWANLGVEGHWQKERPWLQCDEQPGELMAEIVGAKKEEVVLMNSLTVNLHMMLVPFYRPSASRYKILMEAKAFPSDRYAVASHLQLHGITASDAIVEMAPRAGEHTLRTEDILATLEAEGPSIALVLFSGVQYYTGQVFPMAEITAASHRQGAYVGFDLAHAVGNVKLNLHDWNVDFAVWCCYKYLNASPGTIGGSFVHGRLTGLEEDTETALHAYGEPLVRLAGWWGHEDSTRFEMDPPFKPIPGALGFRASNQPVLLLATVLPALAMFREAGGMEAVRRKSLQLTGYLQRLLDDFSLTRAGEDGEAANVEVMTPAEEEQRGCQLSLLFSNKSVVDSVMHQLQDEGVIVDYRKPNCIRVAPCPLYNSFLDVWRFAVILRDCVAKLAA